MQHWGSLERDGRDLMKMVMAVVPREESHEVIAELVAAGHTATFVESKGGALHQSSQALFIVVRDPDLDQVLDTISRSCRSALTLTGEEEAASETAATRQNTVVGGAVVFVWELERFEQYGAYGGDGAPEGASGQYTSG
jgi:uncharacterized protein YaaQ